MATTRVAYLGPAFSYSHLAAIERFGQSSQLLPVAAISAVFEAVHRGDAQYGIVPIENSTDGRIVDTLEMFVRLPVCICGEVPMRIHHCLLAKCALPDVREVHSKPQALSQCRQWLSQQLPHAAHRGHGQYDHGCAERRRTARRGGDRQPSGGCELRTVGLGRADRRQPRQHHAFCRHRPQSSPRTGRDKTSLLFELAHQPGSLADAMAVFKRHRLNLTWIESFPKKGSQNEYFLLRGV